ncbi:hypothetical protein DRE_03969 [Drechslerella stenobrocha 248]|uniref:Uncharacterized protein n=1 Tax=Drechslerella stenobrocha 248 TaxID=1043628 RepID=W7HTK0_9PEZI|nr:hypothetical protein DRE_03969 [Drechslerella stenobrocha 248]
MSTKYVLFDIPSNSNPPTCWSPNTWKARGIMNYKGVPYETEWVEYPDIKVRLAAMGIPPKDGDIPYTLPMLKVTMTPADGSDPDIKYFTDSADIAKYIHENHPDPDIDFDDKVNEEVLEVVQKFLSDPFGSLVLCEAPKVLPERSAEYFRETRSRWMGMPVEEYKQRDWDREVQGAAEEERRPIHARGTIVLHRY